MFIVLMSTVNDTKTSKEYNIYISYGYIIR